MTDVAFPEREISIDRNYGDLVEAHNLRYADGSQSEPRQLPDGIRMAWRVAEVLLTGAGYVAVYGAVKPLWFIAKNTGKAGWWATKKTAKWYKGLPKRAAMPIAGAVISLALAGIQFSGLQNITGFHWIDNQLQAGIDHKIALRNEGLIAAAMRAQNANQSLTTADQQQMEFLPRDVLNAADATQFRSEVFAGVDSTTVDALYQTLQDARTQVQSISPTGGHVSLFKKLWTQDPDVQNFKHDTEAKIDDWRESAAHGLADHGLTWPAAWITPHHTQSSQAAAPVLQVTTAASPQPIELTALALMSANNPDALKVFSNLRDALASRYQSQAAYSQPEVLRTYAMLEAAFKIMPHFQEQYGDLDAASLRAVALQEANKISANAVASDSQSTAAAVEKLHSESYLFADNSLPPQMAQGILAASQVTGKPVALGFSMVKESGLNAAIRAGGDHPVSSASGFGQFMPDRWTATWNLHYRDTLQKLTDLSAQSTDGLVDYQAIISRVEAIEAARVRGDQKTFLAGRNDPMVAPIFTYWLMDDNNIEISGRLAQDVADAKVNSRNAGHSDIRALNAKLDVAKRALQYFNDNSGNPAFSRAAHTLGPGSVARLITFEIASGGNPQHISAAAILGNHSVIVVANPDPFRHNRTFTEILAYLKPPLTDDAAYATLAEAITGNLPTVSGHARVAQSPVARPVVAPAAAPRMQAPVAKAPPKAPKAFAAASRAVSVAAGTPDTSYTAQSRDGVVTCVRLDAANARTEVLKRPQASWAADKAACQAQMGRYKVKSFSIKAATYRR